MPEPAEGLRRAHQRLLGRTHLHGLDGFLRLGSGLVDDAIGADDCRFGRDRLFVHNRAFLWPHPVRYTTIVLLCAALNAGTSVLHNSSPLATLYAGRPMQSLYLPALLTIVVRLEAIGTVLAAGMAAWAAGPRQRGLPDRFDAAKPVFAGCAAAAHRDRYRRIGCAECAKQDQLAGAVVRGLGEGARHATAQLQIVELSSRDVPAGNLGKDLRS